MPALLVLIAVAVVLLAAGVVARVVPGRLAILPVLACLGGVAAALLARPATLDIGPMVAVDGLSATLLAALFLLGASGAAPRRPALLGALALAFLAADALTLLAALAAALATTLAAAGARRRAVVPLVAAAIAVGALGWHGLAPDFRFAAIRALPPDGLRAALVLAAAAAAAATLPAALPPIPGALAALYILARLLLDLPGPATPGYWGVPILAAGIGGALAGARRAAAADDLAAAASATVAVPLALAAASLGTALLARGADLLPLATTSAAAAMLLALDGAVWGSLLLLTTCSIEAAVGTTALDRLGGLLRRTPATGLALLVALMSMAAVPLTAGFAPVWLFLQALLASARAGGTLILALVAGAVAALGLTLALLAAAALRLAGTTLLGRARSTRAAAATEPRRPVRLAMAALSAATLVIGIAPTLLVRAIQPAVQVLAGAPLEGTGPWSLASTADAPGYAAPAIALLLVLTIAAAASARRGAPPLPAAPWMGGLSDPGPATVPKFVLWPNLRTVLRHRPTHAAVGRLWLALLTLVLAAVLGWAAR